MKFRAEHFIYCCLHRTLPRKELTERFNAHFGTNHSVRTIGTYCKRNRILTGRKGRYGAGYTPKDGSAPPHTQGFQKGQKCWKEKPIGTIRIDSKDGYKLIKIAQREWRPLHVVEWEKQHGKIPEGYCLRFIDGDKTNCAIDNLALLPRAANMRINSRTIGMKQWIHDEESHVAVINTAIIEHMVGENNAAK